MEGKVDDSIDKDKMEKRWTKEREREREIGWFGGEGKEGEREREGELVRRQPEHRYPSK